MIEDALSGSEEPNARQEFFVPKALRSPLPKVDLEPDGYDWDIVVDGVSPKDLYGIPTYVSHFVKDDEVILVNFGDFHFETSFTFEVEDPYPWEMDRWQIPFTYRQEMFLVDQAHREPWAEYWARDVERLQREIWDVPMFSRAWWPKLGGLAKASFKMSTAGDRERVWHGPRADSLCVISGVTS